MRLILTTTSMLAVIVLQMILSSSVSSADPPLAQIEELNSLATDIETPHTKWAKPWAGGRVRVLFLVNLNANINGLPLRPAVELMQRFDLDADAVLVMPAKGNTYAITFPGESGVYGGRAGEQRLARLLEKPYDCYVVTGPILGHIPDKSRELVLKRVQAGAGLVLFYKPGKADAPLLKRSAPIDERPEMLSGLNADVRKLGRGRVVSHAPQNWSIYDRRPAEVFGLAPIFGTDLPRDVRFEKQGRVVLWAAGREPELDLSLTLPKSLDRREIANHSIRVRWKGKRPTGPMRLAIRIRSQSRGSRELPIARDLETDAGDKSFRLPALPTGSYFVDAIARSARGVEAWKVKELTITSAERITRVQLDRDWGEAGKPIEGTVEVKTQPGAKRTLRVHAVDRYGRVLGRQELAVGGHSKSRRNDREGSTYRFSLPTTSHTPRYLGIEAALVADGEELCHAYAGNPYTIPQTKQDQFNFILWGRMYTFRYDDIAEDLLAHYGVTSRLETSGQPFWYMSRAGMNYTPYCSSGLYRLPDMGPQQPMTDEKGVLSRCDGCWNDEPAVSVRLFRDLDRTRGFRKHGVLIYSMGDEQAVFGSCLHPSCWRVYQTWLVEQYGNIKALNASWGTKFKKIEDVQPIIDESSIPWYPKRSQRIPWQLGWANNEHSSVAPTSGSTRWKESWRNYPRYIDRRSFQYWNFARHATHFRDVARRIDPHAIVGVEGTDIHLDADIDAIVRGTGWWMPYAGENGGQTNEVIRSIAPRTYRYGNFIGWTSYWESFLRGANTVGRWRIDNILTPAMRVKKNDRRMFESARIVSDGLGTLLNVHPDSRQLHDGIVLLHSMTSVKMAKINEAARSYGLFRRRDSNGKAIRGELANRRNHRAWCRAIRACGLQFNYTTDGQIKRGEFDASQFRVMILAQYESIGPAEEAAIRAFVAGGGTLIADVRPGIYGGRGRERKGGVLDDLFGVRHTGSEPAVKSHGRIAGTIADARVAVKLSDLFVNPAVDVTTGQALGNAAKTPLCIVNKVGKGRAILLNFAMWSVPSLAVHDGPDDIPRFFRAIFSAAGLTWPLELVDQQGRRHRNMEAMRWQVGDGLQVVALHGPCRSTWPEPDGSPLPTPAPFDRLDKSAPVTVKLPERMHVAEIRSGRETGPTKEVRTGVRPWWPTFLVLSRRRLHAPVLRPVSPSIRRGKTLQLNVTIPDAQGPRVLKIRARNPAGRQVAWFSRSVVVEDGSAKIMLPFAHNERPGRWTISATDIFCGRKSCHVSVAVD